ncbi:hypothetical protein AVEN_219584-1 [Araneus ventricosus]|uniref:Uncharacterized protein n=1 Tax=Araneus ventricosus TaxID=182803 RepID=A0A4Y2ISH9_ARAVE|nr:hypothetical protein AVEN_219584-1 [Araneus ventricosus]
MDKAGDGFNFLKTKFPRLSEAKIKEGIFVGPPQIRQLFKDSKFMKHLNRKEKRTWLAFKNVCVNFLGSKKSDDDVAHVEELLSATRPCCATCRLKCFSLTHTRTFSLKIYEQFRMNTGNGSIKTFLSSRGDFQRSVMRACWQHTAGHWYDKLLLQSRRGKQAPDEEGVPNLLGGVASTLNDTLHTTDDILNFLLGFVYGIL